ncbi:neprilysin-2-like [Aphidius gifuensis]|uniref:neprilysin-2-like n=1 Tax=Aphidius gifuensis TaxID=684658 RepID=UPI001CDC6BF2|nr:neprilysin-2-like [Aphidius gifuensis]
MEKPVALILLVFSISGLVFGTQPSSADNNASDICETHACVHAASRIIKMGNPSVEPCDDFYEFACGSFVNPTESDRKSIVMDTFTELTSKFNKKLEKILEQNITINDFKYLKLAKTLYKICFKKNDIFANSMEPSGGWPVVKGSKWNESAFDFNKTIFRVDNTTRWENYFFKFDSYDDYSSVTVEPYPSELIADWYFEVISYEVFESELFDLEQPNYINYGALGSLAGHEITHGFDFSGKQYDAEGHLNDTWTATSTENFNNKSECIIEQYSNYTVKELGLNLNGSISQGENVADHGGIRAAYRAYSDLSITDKRLPGLFYTPKQMFWISYATMWCQKTTPELLKMLIFDSHPPYKFRVTGTLSNMPEFAKDFKCPSGSNMNPVKKCSVW